MPARGARHARHLPLGELYLTRLVTDPERQAPPIGAEIELSGPVGERNVYACHPRGRIALMARTQAGLREQFTAVEATGNRAVIHMAHARRDWLDSASAAEWSKAALVEPSD